MIMLYQFPKFLILLIINLHDLMKRDTFFYSEISRQTNGYIVNCSPPKDHIQSNLQIALNILCVQSWCENNGMVLNLYKTKVLLITSSQKRARIRTSFSLKKDNISLDITTGDKLLGVHIFINQNLKWVYA